MNPKRQCLGALIRVKIQEQKELDGQEKKSIGLNNWEIGAQQN